MAICLENRCSFGFLSVYASFLFDFEGGILDLIVLFQD